jgi:biopolymer transport protein ExbD
LTDGSVKIGFNHLSMLEIETKLGTVIKSLNTNSDTVLIINGDRDTPHKHISAVMNIAAKAGFSQVRINAEVKAGEK